MLKAKTFVSWIKVKTCLPALGACVGKLKAPLYASVAQLVEYTTDNRVVTGPNPVVCTIAHCADCKIKYMFVGIARQAFDDARGESRYTKSAGVPC